MSVQSEIDRITGNIADAYSAVADMGGEAPSVSNSANLAQSIRSIPTAPAPGTPLDPAEVYSTARPSDWLAMPEPADNEIYLLVHIPDGASSLLAFTVTCTGSCTVALGTVAGGQFVQQSARTAASGSKYEAALLADDYGNLTSDGFKQVMVKVSGTNILTWEPSVHSKKVSPANYASWNIVEIACRLPNGTGVKCGNTIAAKALQKLRFFSWYGTNHVTSMNNMFSNCYNLTAVPQLDTAQATSMSNMFIYCSSLTAIPQLNTSQVTGMGGMFKKCVALTAIPLLDTSQVTAMNNMFEGCGSLAAIPPLDTAQVTNMSSTFSGCCCLTAIPLLDTAQVTRMDSLFSNCSSLSAVPLLDTSQVTNMSSMFNYCRDLAAIPLLDTSGVTNMSGMFSYCTCLTVIPRLNTASAANMSNTFSSCSSLARLAFSPQAAGWTGYAVSLSGCSLGHQALVDLFNSLPAITGAKALTLTGNPGVSELTDAEKAIAAGKNWTLTL